MPCGMGDGFIALQKGLRIDCVLCGFSEAQGVHSFLLETGLSVQELLHSCDNRLVTCGDLGYCQLHATQGKLELGGVGGL